MTVGGRERGGRRMREIRREGERDEDVKVGREM